MIIQAFAVRCFLVLDGKSGLGLRRLVSRIGIWGFTDLYLIMRR